MTNQQIHHQINDVAEQILARLGKQCGSDPHIGIAALAVAMCSLARADGISRAELEKVISIAHRMIELAP